MMIFEEIGKEIAAMKEAVARGEDFSHSRMSAIRAELDARIKLLPLADQMEMEIKKGE